MLLKKKNSPSPPLLFVAATYAVGIPKRYTLGCTRPEIAPIFQKTPALPGIAPDDGRQLQIVLGAFTHARQSL